MSACFTGFGIKHLVYINITSSIYSALVWNLTSCTYVSLLNKITEGSFFQYWFQWEHFRTLSVAKIFIHSVFCLTTGPKPPPKRFLHIVRSRASSFKWEYPLLSLRSSSSFLRLLPRLLATSISPFIFPSITCFRRQFLRKMWPIQLAFRFLISCRRHIYKKSLLRYQYIY